jgi:hypothetical protein
VINPEPRSILDDRTGATPSLDWIGEAIFDVIEAVLEALF